MNRVAAAKELVAVAKLLAYGRISWKRSVIDEIGGGIRYEWVGGGYTIDVTNRPERDQGHPGSNHVDIRKERWGGWLLNTPKQFRTIEETELFVERAMAALERGEEGRKVSFPG